MKDVNDLMQAILEMDAAQRRESEKARLERSARLAALDEQKQKIIAECDAREKSESAAAARAAEEGNAAALAALETQRSQAAEAMTAAAKAHEAEWCAALVQRTLGGEAVAQYGSLKGMALPLLFFPFSVLGALSGLLMPEITRAHTKGDTAAMRRLIFTMLRMTGAFSLAAGVGFVLLGAPLAGFIYRDAKVGRYVQLLGFVAPFMYLESMVDGVLKGLGEQLATFRYSLFDSVFRIAAIWLVVPQYGMMGFLGVMAVSNLMTCGLNMRRMMKQIKKPSP